MAITITLKGRHLVTAGLLTAVLAAGGCSEYKDARGKGDAPIGKRDDSAADVTNFPDGFGNIATKSATVPGKRIWMATHGGAARTFSIENDESCK